MARNQMDDLHRKVVRTYHTLCTLLALTDEDKRTILSSYGVESSVNMETHDLIDVCGSLQKMLDKRSAGGETMDALRKRCLKALCMYIDAKGVQTADKLAYAKAMACRAGGKEDFNRLTAAELRGVIGYFNSERKAFEGAKGAATTLPDNRKVVYLYTPLHIGEA